MYMRYPMPKRYVEYITKPFKSESFTALHGVSMTIKTGDRVAFLGANGAGKTTLLKLIGGLLYPGSGTITVNNFDTISDNLKARKSVGFVLNEERSFYWRLSGTQNMEFFGSLDNLHGARLKSKVQALLHLVGLEEAGKKLFAGYSSGMKQRLAIARGLLSDPPILILDEPTRTLDPVAVKDVKNILLERVHANRERTLLIATHSLYEAQTLCNKFCFMKKGKIALYATLQDITDRYGSLEHCYNTIFEKRFEENFNHNNEYQNVNAL